MTFPRNNFGAKPQTAPAFPFPCARALLSRPRAMAKLFTRQEVAKYTGVDGKAPFIIIHNHVYDVTPWLNDHPGGCEILLQNAGTDATVVFEDTHTIAK